MKLEGYRKVAVINYRGSNYHFALYDEDIVVGDTVMVSGSSPVGVIEEIIPAEEAANRFNKAITQEVICKVDMTAYSNRLAGREEKERLKKEMEKRKIEIQKFKDDEYYASVDDTFAEMLNAYRNIPV